MKKLSFAYFGSAYFSADLLQKIILDKDMAEILDLKFIVTQPDRPVGRKQILTPTPVSAIANKYNIEVLKINNLKSVENLKSKINGLDFCLLYAYGAIIPSVILDQPKQGFWNIHPSLLPLYRGTSPMATPLINGDKTTGVTLLKMDTDIDHGPIIDQVSYTIPNTDYRIDLEKKLTDLGFQLFKKNILAFVSNNSSYLPLKEQSHEKATYTKKLKKQDGFIEIEDLKSRIDNSPKQLFDRFRGLSPWPGIWTLLPSGKRLKIINFVMESGKLSIKTVQMEGKNEVDFKTFNKAYDIF